MDGTGTATLAKNQAANNQQPAAKIQQTGVFAKRWLILSLFCALSMSNAFQWIEYAIISNIIVKYYGVDYKVVDWTSMIYIFVLDKYGLRLVALLGSFGNCLGAIVKCASASPDRFIVTFIGQAIVGSSQIFILGLPPRLAAVWFGPKEVSTACALGVFGNQLGIAIGFLIPPMIVRNHDDLSLIGYDLQKLFFASAAVNAVIFLLVFAVFTDAPRIPPSPAQMRAIEATMDTNFTQSLKKLMTNRDYILLLITYGLNVGAFYAVSTLLNQMVLEFYPGEEINIGRIGLLIVVAGMAGSIACGIVLDRTHFFKMTTLVVYTFSFLGQIIYTFTLDLGHLWLVFIVAGFLGFFMTGYLALGFEFGAELTYPISEGTVSGMLNAAAQVFGVAETMGMAYLLEKVSIFGVNIALCIILLVGTVLTMLIRPRLHRQAAHKAHEELELEKLNGVNIDALTELSRDETKDLVVEGPESELPVHFVPAMRYIDESLPNTYRSLSDQPAEQKRKQSHARERRTNEEKLVEGPEREPPIHFIPMET